VSASHGAARHLVIGGGARGAKETIAGGRQRAL